MDDDESETESESDSEPEPAPPGEEMSPVETGKDEELLPPGVGGWGTKHRWGLTTTGLVVWCGSFVDDALSIERGGEMTSDFLKFVFTSLQFKYWICSHAGTDGVEPSQVETSMQLPTSSSNAEKQPGVSSSPDDKPGMASYVFLVYP